MTVRGRHRRASSQAARPSLPATGLALIVGLAIVLGVLALSPGQARADEPTGDYPDACEYFNEDYEYETFGNWPNVELFANGNPYLRCDSCDSPFCDPHISWDEVEQVVEDWPYECVSESDHSDHSNDFSYYCLLEDDLRFEECYDDIRFAWDAWWDDNEETEVGSSDTNGFVVVPAEIPEGLEWWWAEFAAENLLSRDEDYPGGQGCEVGRSYPYHQSCAEINDRKEELRGQLDDAEEAEEAAPEPGSGVHPDTVGAVPRIFGSYAAWDAARAELQRLENVGGFIPEDCWGPYPSDAYQVTWGRAEDQEDDGELGTSSRLMGWLATIIFAIGKTFVLVMLWLVRLAFTFDVGQYRTSVGDFASRIDRDLIHLGDTETFSMFEAAWLALFAYAGFQALRGRTGRAAGEIGMAILLAAIGVVLVGDFFPESDRDEYDSALTSESYSYEEGSYFDSVSEIVNASGLAMLRVANVDDESGEPADLDIEGGDLDRQEVEDLIRATGGRLQHEFIERPYYFINYGQEEFSEEEPDGDPPSSIAPSSTDDFSYPYGSEYQMMPCSEVVGHVQSLPHTEGPWIERFFRRNKCEDLAEWNEVMTQERLASTVLVATVSIVVSVAIGLAAVTLMILKFLVAVLFVALPVAVVMAILPGRSRSLAFGWATSLLQLWLAAIGCSMVLAVVLMGVDVINKTAEGRPLAERWVMTLLVVVTLYILRKRIVSGSQSVANTLQDRLTATTGDTANWGGGGGARGRLNDIDLAGVDRGAARAGMAGRLAAMAGGAAALRAGMSAGRMGMRVADAPRRSMVAEYGRRRSAALSQAWHWRNTMEGQRYGQAQNIAKDPTQSREGRLKTEFNDKGKVGVDKADVLHEQRLNARGAQVDVRRLEKAGTKGNLTSLDAQNSADRLLGERNGVRGSDRWNAATKAERKQMLTQARQTRDLQVIEGGGKDAVSTVGKSEVRDHMRHMDNKDKNGKPKPGPISKQQSYDDKQHALQQKAGLSNDEWNGLLKRDKEMRTAGIQSEAEAASVRRQHDG